MSRMTSSSATSTSSSNLDEKYFGENSKKSFVDTYRQLKRHGDIMVGGYKELDKFISKPMDQNEIAKSIEELKLAGVITPRPSLGDPPSHPPSVLEPLQLPVMHKQKEDDAASSESHSKGRKVGFRMAEDDAEGGTFITRIGMSDDDNSSATSANHIEQRTISEAESIQDSAIAVSNITPFGGLDSISELELGSAPPAAATLDGGGSVDSLDMSILDSQRLAAQDEEDLATEYTYRSRSPRALFISGCLKHNIPPITVALVRKNLTSTINLSHMGIGDTIAEILSGCLSTLPYLQVLNLSDNHLTDSGLADLLISASHHKELESLDVSNNIIGLRASTALGEFLGNPDCRLHSLRLQDSNIDDSECHRICKVLKHNQHLTELDLSKNELGKEENLNVVKPSFVTGGESLAELLLEPTCCLKKLVLHWNMIRLDGATALCGAVHSNKHLVHLDLSYNSICRSGACVLGHALTENASLTYLNVANNNIDDEGAFTLLSGVADCQSLRHLIIDGNPIGEQGCMALVSAILHSDPHLKIDAQSCDFRMTSTHKGFSMTDVYGSHTLDMSSPYHRAILVEILRMVAINPRVGVKSLDVQDSSGRGGGGSGGSGSESYLIGRDRIERSSLSDEDHVDIQELEMMSKFHDFTYVHIYHVCKKFDYENLERFNVSHVEAITTELGILCTQKTPHDISIILDPFSYGYIEIGQFYLYLRRRASIAKRQISDICNKHITVAESSTSGRGEFVVPVKGSVKIEVFEPFLNDAFETDATRPSALSLREFHRIVAVAAHSTNSIQVILNSLTGRVIYLEEARYLYGHLVTVLDDPVEAVAKLLPHVSKPSDCSLLLRCTLGYDMTKIRRLKQKLGPIFNPLLGIYNGFYKVDLSNPLHRRCWSILLQKSVIVMMQRRRNNLGELSQYGDGVYCFRNIHIVKALGDPHASNTGSAGAGVGGIGSSGAGTSSRGGGSKGAGADGTTSRAQSAKPPGSADGENRPKSEGPGGWEIELSPEARREVELAPLFDVSTIPKHGKLEFDFIYSIAHDRTHQKPLSDTSFIRILHMCRLVEEADIDATLDALHELAKHSRKQMASPGKPFWRPSIGHVVEAGNKAFELYSTLSTRVSTMEEVSKREILEIDPSMDASRVIIRSPTATRSRTPFWHPIKSFLAEKYVEKFTAMVRTKGKSLRLVSKNAWVSRLRAMMTESTSSAEFKSVNLCEYLISELSDRWLYCRQLSVILRLFQCGVALQSQFGSYRVYLIVTLFDRIVDICNFQFVLMHLNAHELAAVMVRIGVLNYFNPSIPEGGYCLDMARWDERQIVKIMIHLSIVEPGENFIDEEYAFDRDHLPIPGWELKVTWFNENMLPRKGVLSLEVFSGEGMMLNDCKVDRTLRNMMHCLTLVPQRDIHQEIVHDIASFRFAHETHSNEAHSPDVKFAAVHWSDHKSNIPMEFIPRKIQHKVSQQHHQAVMSQQHPQDSTRPFSPTAGAANDAFGVPVTIKEEEYEEATAVQKVIHNQRFLRSSIAFDAQDLNKVIANAHSPTRVASYRGLQQLHSQLTLFRHYESTPSAHRATTVGTPTGGNSGRSRDSSSRLAARPVSRASKEDEEHCKRILFQPYLSETMNVYRMDDLQDILKAKTPIQWTYAAQTSRLSTITMKSAQAGSSNIL